MILFLLQYLFPCEKNLENIYVFYFHSMTLNQRSNDYIMSGYINKIQYVSMQMMVASHVGYDVGKFCHFVQNLHIYDRHIGAALEIIDREEIDKQPSISLGVNKKFYDFVIDDFIISNVGDVEKLKSTLEIVI